MALDDTGGSKNAGSARSTPQADAAAAIKGLLNEGLAHFQAGNYGNAHKRVEKALELGPYEPDSLNLLGLIAAQEGRMERAIELLRLATLLRPDDHYMLNNLGRVLFETWRYEAARDPLERAVALRPDNVASRYNLGSVLRQLGRTERALALWQEVCDADAAAYPALVGIIEILTEQGNFERAEAMAREVLDREPQLPAAWLALARVRRFTADDGTLEAIERQLALPGLDPRSQATLRFAAGKICDDLARYDEAYHHFSTANRAVHAGHDARRIERLREERETVFTEAFFRERQGWGFDSDLPVFIVGMPRSGTTLAEQILAAHPDVFGAGEITTLDRVARFSEQVTSTGTTLPGSARDLTRFGAELAGRRYVERLRAYTDSPASRIANKTPHNFEMLGFIALILPGAKIIHCRRGALDTCVSCFTSNFTAAHSYNRSFADLGRYYSGYQRLMQHWHRSLPLTILDVDYEDMVRDLEATARRMVDFAGLGWDSRCLDHRGGAAVRSPSAWQVRQPLYTSSIGRWRHYTPHVQELIDNLGAPGGGPGVR